MRSRSWPWVLVLLVALAPAPACAGEISGEEARQLREEVRGMFYHAFEGYMRHAFPRDELRPLSCTGEDSLGAYALTLIDSLDTLALLGDRRAFSSAVHWVGANVQFDIVSISSISLSSHLYLEACGPVA